MPTSIETTQLGNPPIVPPSEAIASAKLAGAPTDVHRSSKINISFWDNIPVN